MSFRGRFIFFVMAVIKLSAASATKVSDGGIRSMDVETETETSWVEFVSVGDRPRAFSCWEELVGGTWRVVDVCGLGVGSREGTKSRVS